VGAFEGATENLRSLKEQIQEAEATLSSTWADATSAGWTPRELRTLGFTQPAARRGGAVRKRRAREASASRNLNE